MASQHWHAYTPASVRVSFEQRMLYALVVQPYRCQRLRDQIHCASGSQTADDSVVFRHETAHRGSLLMWLEAPGGWPNARSNRLDPD